jgi:hypothetical protein
MFYVSYLSCRLNSLLKDFNIFVLKLSSLLESAEFLSLLAGVVFGRLAEANGIEKDLVAFVIGVVDGGGGGGVVFVGGVISLIHTAPETK